MRKRILKKFAVVLLAFCFISLPLAAAPAGDGPRQQSWHFSDLFSSKNFWTAVSQEITLDEVYDDNDYVKKQIHWFRRQQDYLSELTHNAKPYIYYVLEQTRKRDM